MWTAPGTPSAPQRRHNLFRSTPCAAPGLLCGAAPGAPGSSAHLPRLPPLPPRMFRGVRADLSAPRTYRRCNVASPSPPSSPRPGNRGSGGCGARGVSEGRGAGSGRVGGCGRFFLAGHRPFPSSWWERAGLRPSAGSAWPSQRARPRAGAPRAGRAVRARGVRRELRGEGELRPPGPQPLPCCVRGRGGGPFSEQPGHPAACPRSQGVWRKGLCLERRSAEPVVPPCPVGARSWGKQSKLCCLAAV